MEFITPIVKCVKGKEEMCFFTLPEFDTWLQENNEGKGWKVKYYKGLVNLLMIIDAYYLGLGTSTSQEAKEYFGNMGRHLIPFKYVDQEDDDSIDLAFSKKKVDDRKDWLRNLKPGTYLDHDTDAIRYQEFVNKELILFSMADNVRSIPSMVDGFKPGQRKV